MLNKLNSYFKNIIQDIDPKLFAKGFFTYLLVSIVFTFILLLLHRPPEYYVGSMVQYVIEGYEKNALLNIFVMITSWSLCILPLLYLFKGKYYGIFFLGIFSLWAGTEVYFFYLQGGEVSFNIGVNQYMIENILKALETPTLLLSASDQYSNSPLFNKYMIGFSLMIFIITFIVLKFLPRGKYNFLGLFFVLYFLTFVNDQNRVPYFLRLLFEFENHAIEKTKDKLLNIQRKKIYNIDLNTTKKRPKNIILLMDESIRGDYLSVNSNDPDIKKATPIIQDLLDQGNFKTFGVMYSIGNCSSSSNTFTLIGGRHKYKTEPTIFQYMKHAGYETIRLDAPHTGYHNGVTYYDTKYIDKYISAETQPTSERDSYSVREIGKIIKEKGNKFIYFTKQGSHIPFYQNYDKKNKLFENNNPKYSQKWFKYEYLNSINWSVNENWKELLKVIKDTDTVIVWQSDHGINMGPDKENKRILISHCESTLNHFNALYNVAGGIYSTDKDYLKGYKNLNESSTINIFPTLLDLAGYENYTKYYADSFKNPEKGKYPIFTIEDQKHFLDAKIIKNRTDIEFKDWGVNKRKSCSLY